MSDLLEELRIACAEIARQARQVRVAEEAIPAYAAALPLAEAPLGPDPVAHLITSDRETAAAFWLTLDTINFGSGWFPTLRKPGGRSGYFTIASGVKGRFERTGPWAASELAVIQAGEVADVLGQDPQHELMERFAGSLRDLGGHIEREHAGRFAAAVDAAAGSAASLVHQLAGWRCFADTSCYGELRVPFLKRAQIAAADLHRAGVARFGDLRRLTLFADNLVPHVLRLDGILVYTPELVERIESHQLLQRGSPEEVEIRACALHAVELITARRPDTCPAEIDQLLWLRGQGPSYKGVPRHRARGTAY